MIRSAGKPQPVGRKDRRRTITLLKKAGKPFLNDLLKPAAYQTENTEDDQVACNDVVQEFREYQYSDAGAQ